MIPALCRRNSGDSWEVEFAGGGIGEIGNTLMGCEIDDIGWQILIDNIRAGRCTPFLGAGMSADVVPLGKNIANRWASTYGYPFADPDDLARVAQYVAIQYTPGFMKQKLVDDMIRSAGEPDFQAVDEPHRVLAALKLPIYITTNYDHFMTKALELRRLKPRREVCRWHSSLDGLPTEFARGKHYVPTPAEPLVYHLHGSDEHPESIVISEDDYLEFLTNLSTAGPDILPQPVCEALANNSLLFIGYGLRDWTLRVLVLSLRRRMHGATSFAVLLPPENRNGFTEERLTEYQQRYFENIRELNLRTYWGTAREFVAEIVDRSPGFCR